jgi:uncharacterized protein YciI
MRTFAVITPGPAWTDGRPIFDQDASVLAAHLDTMRDLFDRRTLLLGGPERGGRSGFALFDTDTVERATEHMDADPAVRSGIFQFTMHELNPYFDAFDLTRHSRG